MVIAKAERTVAAKTDDRRIMGPVLVGDQCIPDELASSEFAGGFTSLSAAILRAGVLSLAKWLTGYGNGSDLKGTTSSVAMEG